MNIDIDSFLETVASEVKDKDVPVVDLIAVQTRDPFKVLVATILSARTKDETTARASKKLFKRAPDRKALRLLTEDQIAKLIYPVGFYKNKAAYLTKLPAALEQFGEEVPDTIEELITLPGVGRKTANLVVSVAFGKPAICVDTHVHRILNIWNYVETDTPLKTEMALREKLPERHWIAINSLLVAFGQSICRPVSPHCDICNLADKCPRNGVKPRKIPGSKRNIDQPLRFISWNVNGIRALEKKGFRDIVVDLDPDIIGIQETKAQPDQLSEELKNIPGYTSYWHSAKKKGYSGVAFYTRLKPVAIHTGLGNEEFDSEGRVLTLEFKTYYLINIYFPNSGDKLKRLDFKLRFNDTLLAFALKLGEKKDVILCGDFNVAHKEIDLKNPKNNIKHAGFTPEERHWMDSFIEAGFTDTFRIYNQEPEQYSWWSYRFNARAKNIGWRIDYFCVDESARKKVADAAILQEVTGSDHCPVQLEYLPR
ncbi:MAG: exodeoxyribonuclease III [Deltaproteobacteria bacterium]|nr:exodeoxyribonuclease III [Deltaproteobacteria bacterium]